MTIRATLHAVGLLLYPLPDIAAVEELAAEPPPHLLRQYHEAVDNTAVIIWERIEPLLSEEQRTILHRVVVRVQPDSWNVYGIEAPMEDGVPVIAIPLGLVFLQDHIDSAVVATGVGGLSNDVLTAYIREFVDGVRENIERTEENKMPLPLPAFPSFAGVSPQKWNRITQSNDYQNTKEVIKLSSFAFILLHEFGHHLDPKARFELRETEADTFAADLATRAGFDPALAFYTFAFFASLEGHQSFLERKVGYPPPLCRGLYFVNRGRAVQEADPEFIAYLKRQGLWDQWVEAPKRIQEILAEDGVSCSPDAQNKAQLHPVDQGGVSSELEAPDYENPKDYFPVRVRSWRPTPGACNGIRLEFYIDGIHVTDIDNTLDSSPVDLGDIEVGSHTFDFESIEGFCIEPYMPYRMHQIVFGTSCDGTFDVLTDRDLQIGLQMTRNGDIYGCALQ